eukprot:12076051-Heterocapsa_arctica.AAC.1
MGEVQLPCTGLKPPGVVIGLLPCVLDPIQLLRRLSRPGHLVRQPVPPRDALLDLVPDVEVLLDANLD